jgi:hypothetical protein
MSQIQAAKGSRSGKASASVHSGLANRRSDGRRIRSRAAPERSAIALAQRLERDAVRLAEGEYRALLADPERAYSSAAALELQA